jgi:hypothetical protein
MWLKFGISELIVAAKGNRPAPARPFSLRTRVQYPANWVQRLARITSTSSTLARHVLQYKT